MNSIQLNRTLTLLLILVFLAGTLAYTSLAQAKAATQSTSVHTGIVDDLNGLIR